MKTLIVKLISIIVMISAAMASSWSSSRRLRSSKTTSVGGGTACSTSICVAANTDIYGTKVAVLKAVLVAGL